MPAHADVNADNARVRVTTWSFLDGDAIGHHRHEYDYVVVPITDNTFEVANEDGTLDQGVSSISTKPSLRYRPARFS
ncbi:MAG TPA: hypothetical protein VEF89_26055 [Solirubrobacteraceae bacterium]|nr:hypothetical protein [Solirubrobacteraceae bacterium]